MARADARLEFDATTLDRQLGQLAPRVDAYVGAVMDYSAQICVSYMKQNAPWTDRTGNARSGLRAEVIREPLRRYAISLFHSVKYGIWLEIRWGGKYSIILPTIRVQGPDVMRRLSKLFAKIGGGVQ